MSARPSASTSRSTSVAKTGGYKRSPEVPRGQARLLRVARPANDNAHPNGRQKQFVLAAIVVFAAAVGARFFF
ncbi:hypothetical protein MCP1_30051 [Candidatus Terasakiella magnetica]|nr:hypothetical protein MCP1_30051 [Candidatus Terasakiella magnetica]